MSLRLLSLIWLILASVLFGLLAVAAIFPGIMLVMAFDAPGSEENPVIWTLVLSVWTTPVTYVLAMILSWTLFAFQRYVVASVSAALPLANVVTAVVAASLWS